MMNVPTILTPTVHFLTGKGGVGKSLLAKTLARYFAQKGHKTLLVKLSEEESGMDMEIAPIEKISANLYHIKIFPDLAAFQYLLIKIPQRKVLKALWSKKLFRALCSAMPGLSDLTRLGKIWFHASLELDDEQEIFEKIVVDLPSSGFVKRFLSVAQVVEEAVKIGPLAKEARKIHEYFNAPENALLHVVTMPEELIVKETKELIKEMNEDPPVKLGMLIINRYPVYGEEEIKKLQNENENLNMKKLLTFIEHDTKRKLEDLAKLKELSLPAISIKEQWGKVSESAMLNELKISLGAQV